MGEYNKVILLGNLTRDPDLRYTPAGLAVCEFPLAVPHRYRVHDETKEDVCFIDIVVFGRVAERIKEHLHKGSRVLADGRLTQKRWETAAGQKRSKYEVVATTVQFIDVASGPASGQEEDLPI
jgi:single-strand DNA-binding protein